MIRTDRIQQRLNELDLTPFSAARQAGLEAGYVRDILRGKIKEPGASKVADLARILNCSVDFLMGRIDELGRPPGELRVRDSTIAVNLPIAHISAAGAWRAADEIVDEPYGKAPAALVPAYAGFAQWLERVEGDSMNKVLPDGALAHVVDAVAIGYAPRHDDLVVVVRRRAQGAFVERSIKQVVLGVSGVELWPRSYNPKWDQPLSLTAGLRAGEDAEVEIAGKVIAAYLNFGGGFR